MAVDEDDNIYFTDEAVNIIFKMDKKMQNFPRKKVEAAGHWDIAVVGGEIMVCECNNRGAIKVYSKKLEYVTEILSPIALESLLASLPISITISTSQTRGTPASEFSLMEDSSYAPLALMELAKKSCKSCVVCV